MGYTLNVRLFPTYNKIKNNISKCSKIQQETVQYNTVLCAQGAYYSTLVTVILTFQLRKLLPG